MRLYSLVPPISVSAWIPATLALALAGCGDAGFAGSGDFGATPGGVQDMNLARDLIAEGRVPPPEAFVVEGMFSEHELGLEGPPCQTTLCLRGGIGVAPTLADEPSAWLQIGMSSSIDPETFERPSLTLIATVDVSGSMGWGYSPDDDWVTPAQLSQALLHELTDFLDARDRIAVVTYGSDVDTVLTLTSGDRHDTIRQVIDDLDENGSTNMEAGLTRAFGLAREALGVTDETRVLLFTDAQPNVGATSSTEFETMAASAADDGIGLTVLGMGLGLGQELMLAMSHLRGGNAFSFTEWDHLTGFLEDQWPWFVSPLAYDLSLSIETETAHQVSTSYGFPGSAEGAASLDVATVFLSRRRGALLLGLTDPAGAPIEDLGASVLLRYTEISGTQQSFVVEGQYRGEPLDERGHYYEQPVVGKTVGLALLVSGMRDAAEAYRTDPRVAIELMTTVHQRFAADAETLADPALDPEVALAAALLELMENGAPQGDLYGN